MWILVYITTAGHLAITPPMTQDSCASLMLRPRFEESFCFNRDVPAVTMRRKKPL